MAESKNIISLRCVTALDGTAVVHVAIAKDTSEEEGKESSSGNDEPEVEHFSVNIFPVFVTDKLPVNLKINVPLPSGRPFGNIQKQMKQSIIEDLEAGKLIVFLEPKVKLFVNQEVCMNNPVTVNLFLNILMNETTLILSRFFLPSRSLQY